MIAMLIIQGLIILFSWFLYKHDDSGNIMNQCPKDLSEKVCYYLMGNLYFFALIGISIILFIIFVGLLGLALSPHDGGKTVMIINNSGTTGTTGTFKISSLFGIISFAIIGVSGVIICLSILFTYLFNLQASKYSKYKITKTYKIKNYIDKNEPLLDNLV